MEKNFYSLINAVACVCLFAHGSLAQEKIWFTTSNLAYSDTDGSKITASTIFDGNEAYYGRDAAFIMQASTGDIYVVNTAGGDEDYGTIMRVHREGITKVTDLGYAQQDAFMTEGKDGYIYGIKPGAIGSIIFRFRLDGTGHQEVFRETDEMRSSELTTSLTGEILGTSESHLYKFNPNLSGITELYAYSSETGNSPIGKLLQSADGYLYGVTRLGGGENYGVVYRVKPSGQEYQVLHEFDGTSGQYPDRGLGEDSNGNLYGVTMSGGMHQRGVLFKIRKDGSGFEVLHHFVPSDENDYPDWPPTSVQVDKQGNLYGAPPGYAGRAMFRFVAATKTYSTPIASPMTIYHINLFQEISPAIQVLRPANGATNVPVDGTQRVIPIPGSIWYTVQFSPVADFSRGALTSTSMSPENIPKVDLAYNTKYYARAKSSLWPYYGETISFTTGTAAPGCPNTGAIDWQVWTGIEGTAVSTIPVNDPPDHESTLTLFQTPSNYANNYGGRVRGYLCVPQTGAYTFWIASDDNSELWLSTNENPDNKTRIAFVPGHTNPEQWTKYASQKSAPVQLEAGARYYIEALHKDALSADHLAVGWTRPDGSMERPIPGMRLAPFEAITNEKPVVEITSPPDGYTFAGPASISIEAQVTDSDNAVEDLSVRFYNGNTLLASDDSHPFSFQWENVHQGSYTIIAEATDGYSFSRDSVVIHVSGQCAFSGSISWEVWNGISGRSVADIPVKETPDFIGELNSFETPLNYGDNYGARLRAHLCVPEDGPYTFWIASDDNSELWLSTNGRPELKRKIASVPGHTGNRQWDKYPAQKSVQIWLRSNQLYYVEALLKEASGADHLAVGWQLPDGTFEGPIPGRRLIKFEVTPLSCLGNGSIVREIWRNVSGSEISSIPFDTPPDETITHTAFDAGEDQGDNYGSRMRGYICPPATAAYVFFLASDDRSELWLSTDEDPANKVKIASVTGWTKYHQFDKYATQTSARINLVAGQRYYIEALHKERGGADHLSVGWSVNGHLWSYAQIPIPGRYLIPYEEDDKSVCSDSPDAGFVQREVWRNTTGTSISSIPLDSPPDDVVDLTEFFETGTYYANDYGSRIRGYLCVPQSGDYTFWIASDDASELWLSADDSPASKLKIAAVTGHTAFREWTKYATQQSAPIHLTAGQPYYIEALHKEAGGNDHISVGWQLPDGTMERPIATTRLVAFSGEDAAEAESFASELDPGAAGGESTLIGLYPNPTSGRAVTLSISSDKISELKEAHVRVISFSGEVVYQKTIMCDDCSDILLDFKSDAPPGVYLVKVVVDGAQLTRRLAVK